MYFTKKENCIYSVLFLYIIVYMVSKASDAAIINNNTWLKNYNIKLKHITQITFNIRYVVEMKTYL